MRIKITLVRLPAVDTVGFRLAAGDAQAVTQERLGAPAPAEPPRGAAACGREPWAAPGEQSPLCSSNPAGAVRTGAPHG